ncbi:MAG: amidohydrolase family protein [Pseudobdellovibrio sp.]
MAWKPSEKIKFRSPIPTRIISNGEYDPIKQTALQNKVELNIVQIADFVSNEKGLTRRELLLSSGAISIGLLALNKVFGPFFKTELNELLNPELRNDYLKSVSNQFVFDIQTHMVKDDFHHKSLIQFANWAAKINVKPIQTLGSTDMDQFKFPNYMKEIFIDSDTDLAILSGATFSNGDPLPNAHLFNVVASVNEIAQAELLKGYYVINPHIDGWFKNCCNEYPILKPAGWKLFPVGDPLSPNGKAWRLDDEKLIYPFYEVAQKSGIKNICVHKGLLPIHFEKKYPETWAAAGVADLEKAAKDWPDLNFIIFHSALRPFAGDSPEQEMTEFRKTGYMRWTSDLARIKQKLKTQNIYAEIGTSFASCCITEPEFCAAFLGLLINEVGVDNVLWGTDSVWYGSPQWQIEAFRKFIIPDSLLQENGWKINLGAADSEIRNKILGLNSAKLFNISSEKVAKKSLFKTDWVEKANGKLIERSNRYYGYHK